VLDGGGVKGAALVGCLRAAADRGIVFAGYGGTSAGSLVAFLAAIGYTPDQLQRLVVDTPLDATFLPDGGERLREVRRIVEACGEALESLPSIPEGPWYRKPRGWKSLASYLLRNRQVVREAIAAWRDLKTGLGLYDGGKVREWVSERCAEQFGSRARGRMTSLNDLKRYGAPPLKIVASHLQARAPRVYAADGGFGDTPVADAIRASMSYPLVFQPVRDGEGGYLVDGGLSSNLPMFLFEDERWHDGLPIFAFDLVMPPKPTAPAGGLGTLLGDMLDTALEGGEVIQRGILRDLYHIQVKVPEGISTLDFALTSEQRTVLSAAGYQSTGAFLGSEFLPTTQATTAQDVMRAVGARPELIERVLEAARAEAERVTRQAAADRDALVREGRTAPPSPRPPGDTRPTDPAIRMVVMLPTGRGTRMVVYHAGMDPNDTDQELELPEYAGVTGTAWRAEYGKELGIGEHRPGPPQRGYLGMTAQEHRLVRSDRRGILAVPIRRFGYGVRRPEQLPVIGTLSIDSAWTLSEAVWDDENSIEIRRVLRGWSDVLAGLLGE
jgi:NTE family protein